MGLKRPPVVAWNTPLLVYASISGYFLNFKCFLHSKSHWENCLIPTEKAIAPAQQNQGQERLNRRKSFFVWKAKLPDRVQRSPFLPLEGAALLWSTEGASVIQRGPLLTPMQT